MNSEALEVLAQKWRARGLFDQGGPCNTHPVTPLQLGYKVRYGIDWLRFSATAVPLSAFEALFAFVRSFFGCTGEVKRFMGFDGVGIAVSGGIYHFRREDELLDIVLDFPGRALDAVRSAGYSELDLLEMASVTQEKRLKDDGKRQETYVIHGLTCSRVDIVMDVYDKRVNPGVLLKALDTGCFTSKFKSWLPIHGKRVKGQPIPKVGEGMTLNLGHRGSNRSGRVYDKKAEIFVKLGTVIDHCCRFEMENLHDGAEETAGVLLQKGLAAVPGLWAGWLAVKKTGFDCGRIERAENAAWWKAITGESKAITLGLQRGLATPERSILWVDKQVASTLAMIQHFDPELLSSLVADGLEKVRPEKAVAWREFKRACEVQAAHAEALAAEKQRLSPGS